MQWQSAIRPPRPQWQGGGDGPTAGDEGVRGWPDSDRFESHVVHHLGNPLVVFLKELNILDDQDLGSDRMRYTFYIYIYECTLIIKIQI